MNGKRATDIDASPSAEKKQEQDQNKEMEEPEIKEIERGPQLKVTRILHLI